MQHVGKAYKRPRQSLFLADSDDDIEVSSVQVTHKAPPPQEVDLDALFDNFDKDDDDPMSFKPLSVPLDEAELIRQAEARVRKNMPLFTPYQVLPSSSPSRDAANASENRKSGDQNMDKDKEEKKAKRRLVKLDENRLLGPNGFPQLIKMTKDFRIKGKGHEVRHLFCHKNQQCAHLLDRPRIWLDCFRRTNTGRTSCIQRHHFEIQLNA